MAEFLVPERFNKNAADVRALGSAAFTGKILLDFMAARLGWPNLAGRTVLDVGCGTRFVSAIRTYNIPIGRYIGVDVDREMVDWLQHHAEAPNFSFHCVDQRNPMYNPNGTADRADWPFAVDVDLCCMFSVITHQQPPAAFNLFREAHRRVAGKGMLFFSAHLHEGEEDYLEMGSAATNLSSYSERSLRRLLGEAGWHVAAVHPRSPKMPEYPVPVPIVDHFVCRKATL
jgi:SAM-dependent methyltransferase